MSRAIAAFGLAGALGVIASLASAQQPAPGSGPAEVQSGVLESLPITSFATVAAPNETIAAGDLIRVTQYFGAWRLTCDNRLSVNKRVCAVEQDLAGQGFSMTWRIGLTAEGRAVVSIDVTRSVDADKGVAMRVGRTTTSVPFEPCATLCRAVVPFAGFIEQGALHKDLIGFGFSVGGKGVAIAADLDGLQAALQASANPPGLIFNDRKAEATSHPPPASARAVSKPAKASPQAPKAGASKS